MLQTGENNSFSEGGNYDYIITGAGCAGLSLAVHLIQSQKFKDKKILIIDKDAKTKNDRTWCFWEKDQSLFQSIVHTEWKQLFFHAPSISKELAISPYKYKLIRGSDFYRHCLDLIGQQPGIRFLQAAVDRIGSTKGETAVIAGGQKFTCSYIFNSILFEPPRLKKAQYWLLQHFKGWFIKTDRAVFDASMATLMDFRTDQSHGTTFFYVLPFSPTKALVEYTLFSDKVLEGEVYEAALKNYIQQVLKISSYEVEEKEFGVIPMTNFSFPEGDHNIINIGTAGGQTKGSSGYTFKFIQKKTAAIVQSLVHTGSPFRIKRSSKRFAFYDSVLLHILYHKTLQGATVFTRLFEKNKPGAVLKFLDDETTLREELAIISSLPTLPFLKAAIKQLSARIY